MSSSSKAGKILGILAVAVIFGGLFGWWISRQGSTVPVASTPVAKVQEAAPSGPTQNASNTAFKPLIPDAEMITNAVADDPEAKEEPKTWSDKLDAIILGPEDEAQKADKLIKLMKTAPPEVELEYSQHLINFVQDENYAGTAGILTNATTPESVSTVLMNDLLNRNNTLKLPMLLSVARSDDHPLKGQAKEMLELFVQEDHGTNWDDWSDSIDKWLKDNPQ